MRAIWDDTIEPEDAQALDPGPQALDRTPDVLIVGGGAAGLAAAVMCRRAGIDRVCVIEQDRLASGPSGSAAGGLSPGVHQLGRPPGFGALASRGLELLLQLDAEWNGAIGIRRLDWLIASDEIVRPGPGPMPGLELVDADGARAVEPLIGEVGGAIVVRDQAWAHPLRLAAAMARRAGAVATRVRMQDVTVRDERVVEVVTSQGVVSPGSVIFATGNAPSFVSRMKGVPMKGHLLVTERSGQTMAAAVAGSILVLPLPDGRLLAGGTFEPGDDEAVVREEVVGRIRAELGRLVPAAGDMPVERAWCCFRPGTLDDLPVVDRVPGIRNAFVDVGHFRTGLLVAPAAGEALASCIARGDDLPVLAGMELARFQT